MTTEKGPNDKSGALFGLQIHVFFIFQCVFDILTKNSSNIYVVSVMIRVQVSNDNQNEPKQGARHVIWDLGTCFFFCSSFFCLLTTDFYSIQVVSRYVEASGR